MLITQRENLCLILITIETRPQNTQSRLRVFEDFHFQLRMLAEFSKRIFHIFSRRMHVWRLFMLLA